MFLKLSLEGGELMSVRGWGSRYIRLRSRSWWIQEFEFLLELTKRLSAMLNKWSPVCCRIIPNRLNCLRWRKALPGRLPAKNSVTHLGVRGWSRIRFCRVVLWWMSSWSISSVFRYRDPNPENRTEEANIFSVFKLATGLSLWCRPMSEWSTPPNAFLWLEYTLIIS